MRLYEKPPIRKLTDREERLCDALEFAHEECRQPVIGAYTATKKDLLLCLTRRFGWVCGSDDFNAQPNPGIAAIFILELFAKDEGTLELWP